MPGNTTSPFAALMAPLLGYQRGRLEKRDYDDQVREAMRRASIEDEELGMKREALNLDRQAGQRAQQQLDSTERERSRAAGEQSGMLARRVLAREQLQQQIGAGKKPHEIDPFLWEEAGVDAGDYKSIQPYDPSNDPELHRGRVEHGQRIAEIDRQAGHRIGELATRGQMGGQQGSLTPEEERRLKIANANFSASLRATAADMGELAPEDQERLWQSALRRAGLDPMKFGGAPPMETPMGEFDPGGMFGDTSFMRSIGVEP